MEDLIEGNNGLVRATHIRMSNYKTTRPMVKLYPLEISSSELKNSKSLSLDLTVMKLLKK